MQFNPLTSTADAKQAHSTDIVAQEIGERVHGPIHTPFTMMTRTRQKVIHLRPGRTRKDFSLRERDDIEGLPNNWLANNNRYFLAYPQVTESSRTLLLSLPLELRRLIYTYVLETEDSDHHSAFHMPIGDSAYPGDLQSVVWGPSYLRNLPMPHCLLARHNIPCCRHEPISVGNPNAHSLLLTNHQIYHDFAFFLYDTYTFHLQDPTSARIWLWNIGAHIGNIKKLHVRISSTRYDRDSWKAWHDILRQLAEQALALRVLRISIDESHKPGRICGFEATDLNPSAGEDSTLMWLVGEIRTLRTIEMAGGYPDIWLGYLRRVTDARVLEVENWECDICYPKSAEEGPADLRCWIESVLAAWVS